MTEPTIDNDELDGVEAPDPDDKPPVDAEDVTFVYSIIDAERSKRHIRSLLDVVLVFATGGFWFIALAVEWLHHYEQLKEGKRKTGVRAEHWHTLKVEE